MSRPERPIDSTPDYAVLGNEWFVGRYRVYDGWIEPEQPHKPGAEDGTTPPPIRYHEGVRRYFPLQDPTLFSSFIRLGARGAPSEKKILGWVNQYGMLVSAEPDGGGVVDGLLDQGYMTLEQFRTEVTQARSAMLLYADLRRAVIRNLQELLIEIGHNPTSTMVGSPSEINGRSLSSHAVPEEVDRLLLMRARRLLEDFVERKIDSVRVSFWNEASEAPEQVGERLDQMHEYVPTQSWRFADLKSALYLQFYLIMVNAVPLRICEHPNCRTPFPVTRKDRRFCTDTCRSVARRYTR